MTRVARLEADLVANSSSFESSLKRANSAMRQSKDQWHSNLNQVTRNFSTFDSHVRRSIGSVVDLKSQLGGIASIAAGALSAQKVIAYSDAWKQINSRLKLATKDSQELANVQQRLFDIAQNNATPLQETISAYTTLTRSLKENQRAGVDLLGFTDLLAKTLKISGTNAQGAATFIQQFGQAAGSDFKGVAQELATFADQNPYFYGIIRDEADRTGKSIKEMAKDGELSFGFIQRAVENAAGQITKDAEGIQLTVGQSLTLLDNAFLKFIGNNQAAGEATASLALGIKFLADNFGLVANSVGLVAAAFTGNFVGALFALEKGFIGVRLSAALFEIQLAGLALSTRAASFGFIALNGALTTFGGLVTLLGGPVGVAFLATYALMALKTQQAAAAQDAMNDRLREHNAAVLEFNTANESRRKAIEDSTKSILQNFKKELSGIQTLYDAYNSKSFGERFLQNLGGNLGIGKGVKQIVLEGAALEQGIAQLESDLKTFDNLKSGVSGGGLVTGTGSAKKDKTEEKRQKTAQDVLNDLKKETEQIRLQTEMIGKKDSLIASSTARLEAYQKLEAAGVTLTAQQKEQLEGYIAQIGNLTAAQDIQKSKQEQINDVVEDFGKAITSAFEDAIINGGKFGDVMEGLFKDIERAILNATVTKPFSNALGDIFSGTGTPSGGGFSLSGIFGSLLKNIPSFDVGTDYVPRDMLALIHEGEKITPAAQNNKGVGGGAVSVVINNNNGSNVSASSRDTGAGIELNVMIDNAVADNIGRRGSATNQALKGFSGQGVLRR